MFDLKFPRLSAFALVLFFASSAAIAAPPPSIVLISVDTLRADHLSSYGYARRTSPAIDAVAARGLVFERALVPEPQTSPSHASLLTGIGPWKHGLITNGFRMAEGVDTLAAALRRVGYDTAGVVAIAHLGSSRGFGIGFNQFSEPAPLRPGESHISSRRDADVVNAEAVRLLRAHAAARAQSPMFLFVHYFDCHFPYRSWDKSEDSSRAFAPEEMKQTAKQTQRYDDGIAWTDRHIGDLLGQVRAKLGDNVVIVITADHGEQIGDHGVPVGHADLYRETVRVPLIIAGPHIDAERVRTRVSNMDVPVALARLAGTALRNRLDGIDLLDVAARDGSLFARIFGSIRERSFLIVGGPLYTRSIALVKGSTWLIKNFDNAYRFAAIASPAPAATPSMKPLAGTIGNGQVAYTVTATSYAPHAVTLHHVARSPQCSASARVLIEPGIVYFRHEKPFRQSIRITVPAARGDVVRLEITPASCAGTTSYEVTREPPAGATDTSDLFNGLVARRLHAGDELYDTDADPLMVHNLIAGPHSVEDERMLRSLFEATMRRAPMQKIPDETLLALRSLGYL